jgi:hypothetical protein
LVIGAAAGGLSALGIMATVPAQADEEPGSPITVTVPEQDASREFLESRFCLDDGQLLLINSHRLLSDGAVEFTIRCISDELASRGVKSPEPSPE